MIQIYKEKKHLTNLIEFFKKYQDEDFYVTLNNTRIFIKDYNSFKLLKKDCFVILIDEEKEINGIICLWKSLKLETNGEKIKREYIKINTADEKSADDLLSVLIWNNEKDLYTKINKNSKFLDAFKRKSFRFLNDRGSQIILKREIDGSRFIQS